MYCDLLKSSIKCEHYKSLTAFKQITNRRRKKTLLNSQRSKNKLIELTACRLWQRNCNFSSNIYLFWKFSVFSFRWYKKKVTNCTFFLNEISNDCKNPRKNGNFWKKLHFLCVNTEKKERIRFETDIGSVIFFLLHSQTIMKCPKTVDVCKSCCEKG